MFHLIGMILSGLLVGVIAKIILPGRDEGGILMTAIIGMVGSIVGMLVGRVVFGEANYGADWVMSILGAILVLILYRWIRNAAASF